MVRNFNLKLLQELKNLDKDPDSCKSALKSFITESDSEAITQFLAQVSETNGIGSTADEYTISLYEVLAQTLGSRIVPHVGSIMNTVVKTLSSSAVSVALHQACMNLVQIIARYGIDLNTSEDEKRCLIQSLCKPLSDRLMVSQESLSSGVALCLKSLVESDNWLFASHEIVNEVCVRAAAALEGKKCTQIMSLITALAKKDALIVEAYARLLLNSGLQILQAGAVEGDSQKRFYAIGMVNCLLKNLEPRSILSELGIIIEEMDKCESDEMEQVKEAAFDCLLTAKRIASLFASPESQTPSPSRSNSLINVDNVKIHSSPRNLIHSLQDDVDMNSEIFHKQFLTPCSNCDWSQQNDSLYEEAQKIGNTSAESDKFHFHMRSESVSSTEEMIPSGYGVHLSDDMTEGSKTECPELRKWSHRAACRLPLCFLFVILTVATCSILINNQEEGNALVPT
ncbi:unnamed protein product [Rhodiola kirilowii]